MITWSDLTLPPLNLYNFPRQRIKEGSVKKYQSSRKEDKQKIMRSILKNR